MYSFYETIKNEVDLQDLAEYLNDSLEKLKLLQIKLEEYKSQNIQDNKIEIEELIRETNKLEKNLFPDLINNYCKLSLEFRNNNVIKQEKDKYGNKITYTSKDLLLKNMAKLIEHINLLDDKFYTYFSFDFLVNSRIISDLGYQENFIDDNEKDSVILKNKYVFSKEDARKIIDKQLGFKIKKERKNLERTYNNVTTKTQLKKQNTEDDIDQIFIKKENNKKEETNNQDLEKEKSDDKINHVTSGGSNLVEIMLVVGLMTIAVMLIFTVYGKVSVQHKKHIEMQNEKQIAFEQQKEKIRQLQSQSNDMAVSNIMSSNQILQELDANKERNGITYQKGIDKSYKEVAKLMSKSIEWKKANNTDINELNYLNLIKDGYTLNEGYTLGDNKNVLFNNQIYTLNMQNDKVEVKVSNIFKNECQYMGIKLSNEYEIKANDKTITPENTKEVCELTNTMYIVEK